MFDLAATNLGLNKPLPDNNPKNNNPSNNNSPNNNPSNNNPSNNNPSNNNPSNTNPPNNNPNPSNSPTSDNINNKSPFNIIKNQVAELSATYVSYNTKQGNDYNLQYQTDLFKLQVYDSNSIQKNNEYSIKNNLTIVDSNDCLVKIKAYLGVSNDTAIPMQKIDWDSSLSSSGEVGSVSYNYFNPLTGVKLDEEEICKDSTIKVKIPLNTADTNVNLTLYEMYKNKSINIYDKDSSFYTSRCVNLANTTSDGDITLGQRRNEIFPNVSIACSVGCTFEGIDENSYIICDCVPKNNTDAKVNSGGFFDTISNSNLDIVVCIWQVLNSPEFFNNPGFWCNGSFLIATFAFISIYQLIKSESISKNLKSFIKSDGTFFTKNICDFNKIINSNNAQEMENRYDKVVNNEDKTKRSNNKEEDYAMSNEAPGPVGMPISNLPIEKENIIWINSDPYHRESNENLKIVTPNKSTENPDKIDDKVKVLIPPIDVNNSSANLKNSIIPKENGNSIETVQIYNTQTHIRGGSDNQSKIDKADNLNNNNFMQKDANISIYNNENKQTSPKVDLEIQRDNDVIKAVKYKVDLKLIQELFTNRDYKSMSYDELLKLDKRSFCQYYLDRLYVVHNFFKAFFYKSLLIPGTIRIILFFLVISFAFALNAIFYSDDYIEERTKFYIKQTQTEFLYTLSNQFWKSVWSIIIGTIPIILMNFVLYVPNEYYEPFNQALLTVDKNKIKLARLKLMKKMKWRYAIFYFCAIILHLFSWFYVTVFCGVYTKSSVTWICGGILSVIIKFIVLQFILPLLHTLVRTWARRRPNSKSAKFTYQIFLAIL